MPVRTPENLPSEPDEVTTADVPRLPVKLQLDDNLSPKVELVAIQDGDRVVGVIELPEGPFQEPTADDEELRAVEESGVLEGVPDLPTILGEFTVTSVTGGEGLRADGQGVVGFRRHDQTITMDKVPKRYKGDDDTPNAGTPILRVTQIPDHNEPFKSPYSRD